MTNKNILIVGSSGGIGKAFVDIFAKQYANNKIIGLSRSENKDIENLHAHHFLDLEDCLLYTSPSPRDVRSSRMPSSA